MRNEELREIEQAMAHWGFAVFDPVHPRSPGFRRLIVAVRPTPTYEHFDPEHLAIQTWGRLQAAEPNTWGLHTTLDSERQVVPGNVVVSDRVHKRYVFFTFGGTVQVATVEGPAACTYFVIDSPAPILSKSNGYGFVPDDQLAEDVESLFARLRARAHLNGYDFDRQLIALTPMQVYTGCIVSLWGLYSRSPALAAMFPDLCKIVRNERAWLAEQPTCHTASLEQLVDQVDVPRITV